MADTRRAPFSVWLRRLSQLVFFAVFVWLFLETTYHPINTTGGRVTFFFDLDPLILFTVWVSAHVVPAALFLSLVTLVVTLLFGRLFCGWFCPFGALHTFFSCFRSGKAKQKLAVGGYSPWQRVKYLALTVFVAGGALGLNAVGWIDPFSFLFRSMATVLYPVFALVVPPAFDWLHDTNPLGLRAVSEPIYQTLRRHALPVEQPHYVGAFVIGALFVGVVALNLYRERFWCRYVCPLGALLGVVGKNPLLRVTRNEATCTDCRFCRVDCHGGANPDGDWRPAECLYCWNCVQACPTKGIRIRLALPHPPPQKEAQR
jgi:polyferredoxin